MSVPCDDAPDNAIGTRREGHQSGLKERRVSGVDVPISRVDVPSKRVLHMDATEQGLKGAVEPDLHAAWRTGIEKSITTRC